MQRNFELAHQHQPILILIFVQNKHPINISPSTQRTQFLRPVGRRPDLNCASSFSRKIVSTMGIQTKYTP